MKGFSGFGNSPVKHRKDGKWTGHEHKTKLGKLTGKIAQGIKDLKDKGYTYQQYGEGSGHETPDSPDFGKAGVDVWANTPEKGKYSWRWHGKQRDDGTSIGTSGSEVSYHPDQRGLRANIISKKGKPIFSTEKTMKKYDPPTPEQKKKFGPSVTSVSTWGGPRVTKIFGHELKAGPSRKEQQRKDKERQKKFGFTFKG